MRRFKLFKTLILILLLSIQALPALGTSANPAPSCVGSTCTIDFVYTGSFYSWTVPAGSNSITFDVQGAQGGTTAETYSPALAGLGGRVTGTLTVTPGQTLNIYVGGAPSAGSSTGGFNGGGNSGTSASNLKAGPGGGASDIRTSTTLASRIIVAGGGGGAGTDYVNGACTPCGQGGAGGNGGNTTGASGQDNLASNTPSYLGMYGGLGKGGTGGTQSSGGTNAAATPGGSGAIGIGGNGVNGAITVASGGGGGGYYGGAGGGLNSTGADGYGGGGGGGGSSFVDSGLTSGVSHSQGYKSGNGFVRISYTYGTANISISSTSGLLFAKKGQSFSLTATFDVAGKLTFFVDNKRIPGCIAKAVTAGTSICNWKPQVQKSYSISAVLNPDVGVAATGNSNKLNISVSMRSNLK